LNSFEIFSSPFPLSFFLSFWPWWGWSFEAF
jgi:hypothetical protein